MAIEPDKLFTPENIVSVGVATLAVTVVTNTARKLVAKAKPTWVAFGASLVIAYVVVGIQTVSHWYDWVLAFFNACLLFCSALGINEVGAATGANDKKGFAAGDGFFKSWFKK